MQSGSGRWSAPQTINHVSSYLINTPVLAVKPEGDAIVFWAGLNGLPFFTSTLSSGATQWTEPSPIDTKTTWLSTYDIAMDRSGNLVTFWQITPPKKKKATKKATIYAATLPLGKSWDNFINLGTSDKDSSPYLALSDKGTAIYIYSSQNQVTAIVGSNLFP
jgi:hypothetical protein